jgi:hypothetical protein
MFYSILELEAVDPGGTSLPVGVQAMAMMIGAVFLSFGFF